MNLDNLSTSSGEMFFALYEMTALFEITLYFSEDSPGGIRKMMLISLNGGLCAPSNEITLKLTS
ncbi:hypothetical protein MKY08_09870 [Lysinibacillus sp. FSL M8-0337]|uniref:hypothetical protein n=1 Tax=Lysinibacillus TaxID=400634 RepID=UPI00114CA5D2|nr:hypothetical protein [Lysinibacillus sphaericus]